MCRALAGRVRAGSHTIPLLAQADQAGEGPFEAELGQAHVDIDDAQPGVLGQRLGRVSSEWFSRPDDERYLSLSELHAAVKARAEHATTRTVESREVRVEASRDDAERLALILPGRPEPVAPTHWSFGQLCSLVGAPSGYLRQLPAPLAGINMLSGDTGL